MPSFLFAFAAVALVSLGGRDQLLVARLAEKLGRGAGLLVAGCLAAVASAAAMAWAGQAVAALLPEPGRTMLIALALLLAAIELAWPNREASPAEPTRSIGAIALVLFVRQLADGARFLVFALAASSASATLAGMGGALAGCLAIGLGWSAGGDLEANVPLRPIRLALAVIVLVTAVALGLSARGIVA